MYGILRIFQQDCESCMDNAIYKVLVFASQCADCLINQITLLSCNSLNLCLIIILFKLVKQLRLKSCLLFIP